MSEITAGWIEPPDKAIPGEYWLTRRDADAIDGYGGFGTDIRVIYCWAPSENAWITGTYQGRQRPEPKLSCLHSNNGWRLEPDERPGSDPRDAVVAAADALVGALDEYEFTLGNPHLKGLVASYRALRAALKGLGR